MISNGLEQCKMLEKLWLMKNQLVFLPEDLEKLSSLTELDVTNNPKLEIAMARKFQGKELESLFVELKEFRSGTAFQDLVKVMIVGEGIN